jgi:hypothetical protein
MHPLTSKQIVELGSAMTYGVLSGGAGFTNVGNTVVTGDVGTTATSASVTGFGPGIWTGTNHFGDNAAIVAFTDGSDAYAQAAALPADHDYSTLNDFTGTTIYPGVYFIATGISFTGSLTLDAQGDPNASWVFQMGTTLKVNVGSQVVLTNGAKACNVFWKVGSSATIAVGVEFHGNVLAHAGIAIKTGASVGGLLFAKVESITLEGNAVTAQVCQA